MAEGEEAGELLMCYSRTDCMLPSALPHGGKIPNFQNCHYANFDYIKIIQQTGIRKCLQLESEADSSMLSLRLVYRL